ncbi:MAG: guanylate kinase [Oligoflexales bacterium]
MTAQVFVMTAPSGTGKTTLTRRLLSQHTTIKTPSSLTTRTKRPNEKDGDHYRFVSEEQFKEAVEQKRLLEWAQVFGNYYGTTFDDFDTLRENAEQILLEIDVQGWHQIQERVPESKGVFIMPPSLKALWERLSHRGTESLATRWSRLEEAHTELQSVHTYDHFIINVSIEEAYDDLEGLVIRGLSPRLPRQDAEYHAKKLLDEYRDASWIQQLRSQF